jgi:hypothetical protein
VDALTPVLNTVRPSSHTADARMTTASSSRRQRRLVTVPDHAIAEVPSRRGFGLHGSHVDVHRVVRPPVLLSQESHDVRSTNMQLDVVLGLQNSLKHVVILVIRELPYRGRRKQPLQRARDEHDVILVAVLNEVCGVV